ncbi:DUF3667 domain-containing protein [Lewinella sp. 4G2]|uniref:DUF3667 domain-containing protein n=1 Tax=Lewinella sp. 4G2 TaxID=1803372 RepID=UPI0007B48D7A|nr:DUF3667 domain-containing protein [Lewinella sp. 4G2]OAV42582.1 hypothetical protein A3850_015155 [Lewinella sp. 4G2]
MRPAPPPNHTLPPDTHCLNCRRELTGKFCANCGQRATTKRFSLKTLWDGQFIEDVLQLNRGLGRTVVDLFYRPGYLALDYIGGHRKKYFNFLALLLLTLGIDLLLRSYATVPLDFILAKRFAIQMPIPEESEALDAVLRRSYRVVIFAILAFVTFLQWLIYWRKPFNFWEHFVGICFLFAMQNVFSILGGILPLFPLSREVLAFNYQANSALITAMTFVYFWQFSTRLYRSFFGRLWRVYLLWMFTVTLAALILAGVVNFAIGIYDPAGLN